MATNPAETPAETFSSRASARSHPAQGVYDLDDLDDLDVPSWTVYSFNVENDVVLTDERYTNGLRYSQLGFRTSLLPARSRMPLWLYLLDQAPRALGAPLDSLAPACLGPFEQAGCHEWARGWGAGQLMYTPRDISRPVPDPRDRPYAGFLYYSSSFQLRSRTTKRIHQAELQVGFVGPFSFAGDVQRRWHDQINVGLPRGWVYQLERTPGLVLLYQLVQPAPLWRGPPLPLLGRVEATGAASGGIAVGNLFDYVGGSAELRVGWGLEPGAPVPFPMTPTLYGSLPGGGVPAVREPRGELGLAASDSLAALDSLAATDPVAYARAVLAGAARQPGATPGRRARLEAYAFARVSARAVAYNYFVEGGPAGFIERRPLTGDLHLGVAVRFEGTQLTLQRVVRAPEFTPGDVWHTYHALAVTLSPWW